MEYCNKSADNLAIPKMIKPHKIRSFMVAAIFISVAIHFIFVYFLLISESKKSSTNRFESSNGFNVTVNLANASSKSYSTRRPRKAIPITEELIHPDDVHEPPKEADVSADLDDSKFQPFWGFGGHNGQAIQAAYQAQHMREVFSNLQSQSQQDCAPDENQDCLIRKITTR
jgi:hypothetical protein